MPSSITNDGTFGLDELLPPYPHPNTSPPTYTSVSSDEDAGTYTGTNSYDMHYATLVHPTTIFPRPAEALDDVSVENERDFETDTFTRLNASTLELYPRSQNIERDLTRGDVELERAGFARINASRMPGAPTPIVTSVFASGRLRAANSSPTRNANTDSTWPGVVQHIGITSESRQQRAEASISDYWTHRQPPAYAATSIRPPVEMPQHVAVSTTPSRSAEDGGPGCKVYCKFFSLAVSLVLFGIAVLAMERKVKRDLG